MQLQRTLRLFAALVAVWLASSASAQSLKVQFRPTWISVNDNQIALVLNVVNTGSSTVALSGVTVRYYFTKDGTQSLASWCDYTPRGCGNITMSFGTVSPAVTNADSYLQVAFGSGAGSLSAGQSTGDIQIRVAKSDWSSFNEANDYSYAGNSSLTDSQTITAAVNGTIVWGTPPGDIIITSDFAVSATPATLTVAAGGTATSTISINRISFAYAVSCTATAPSGVAATFSPTSTTGNSTTLTLAASTTAVAGTSTVTVSCSGASVTRTASIALTVTTVAPDFSLAASPASLTVSQGASGTSTISVTRTNFTSALTCSASGQPSGVTASFSPSSVTGTSTVLTLAASSTATTGPASVTVSCSGGGLTRVAILSLTVSSGTTPDFALTASPATLTVNRGASGTSTISVTRTNLASALTCTASGLPAGVTASFSPTSVTGASTVLTLAASSTATLGAATVTVTCTGGGVSRSTPIALTVSTTTQDFALSASPAAVTVSAGASGVSTIAITRTSFTSAVTLSASGLPTGVTATFTPSSTTGTSSNVTFAASSAAAAGTSAITITGTGGGLTRTTTIALTVGVTTQDFSLAVSPATQTVSAGASGISTITITRTNFTGSVALTASGLPTGVTASFSPASTTGNTSSVTLVASSTAASATATVTITGTSGSLTRIATIAVTVNGGCTGTACTNGWRVNANGRIAHNGSLFQFHCGSWFGLQGRYEISTDSANPRGAPMEQYIGNTFWANGGQGTGRTIASDFREMKNAGITVVRLPVVHQTLDANDPQGKNFLKNYSSVRIANSRLALETMIQEADKAGVYLLLDIHSCSNYVDWRKGRLDARPPWVDANRTNYDYKREDCSCAADNNPSTVTRIQAYNESLWLQDLKTLAGFNKALGVNSVLGIDIYNEPWDYSWSEWKTLIEHAYQAIDSVDSSLLIFAQGISASHGNQLGVGSTPSPTPYGSFATQCGTSGATNCSVNPNWGENLYEAGDDPPNVPKERLVFSPHAYGPSVAVQPQFLENRAACSGLQEQDAANARCNIVINPTILRQGWEDHFGYLKQLGYAVIVGEWGGNLQWPKGKASKRDQELWSYLPTASPGVDEQWQNAFTSYMVEKGIESCYWSINPESGDTLGWYTTPYDPNTNTGGWGEWGAFDTTRTALLNKVWNGIK